MTESASSAPKPRRLAAAGRALLVFLLYLGLAAVVTWPLITELSTQIIGHPFSDTTEYVRHIWWINQSLRAGSLDFLSPNALLLYPDGLNATWLWAAPLQSFPQWLLLFILPLPVAHNLTALITLALNGLAMYVLFMGAFADGSQQGEIGDRASAERGRPRFLPAFLAGLVFAFYPAFQGQLGAGHTGLLVLWPVPLYLLALLRASQGEAPRWRWIFGAGALFAISQWGNMLLLLYIVLPVTALFLLCLLLRRRWRGLLWAMLALALGGLLSLPTALPLLADLGSGAVPREGNVAQFSSSLLTIATPSFYNPLYSNFEYNRRILGEDPFEGAGYIGLIAAALIVIAVLRVKQARFWLLLGLLAWIASLGPLLKIFTTPIIVSADGYTTTVSLPWALLQDFPLLDIARTPVRFNFTIGLAAAVLVGYGAAALDGWLAKRTTPRAASALLVGVGALLLIDFQWFMPMPTIPAEIPAAVRALGEDPSIRAVFDVPWQHLLTDKDALYLQTGHGLPLIGGHIVRRTPLDPAKGTLLQETLDPYLLDAAGVDVIIQHRQWDADPDARAARLSEQFGPPLYADERISVWRVTHEDGAVPSFQMIDALTGSVTDEASLYFYAPDSGTAALSLTLNSHSPRALALLLDDQPVDAPFVGGPFSGTASFELPLTFEAGFHALTLALDPPCVPLADPALTCAAVIVSGVTLEHGR